MIYLIACLAASMFFGVIIVCKAVDVIHTTDAEKLSECKIILAVCVSGLMISCWLFFMDLLSIMGY